MQYKYKRLDKDEITQEQFKQVLEVERSQGEDDCYSEEVMKRLFLEDEKNSNFICLDGEKIVGHISYNPLSKRRNGSIYMVNLIVRPDYRRQKIAQNLIYTACKYYLNKKDNNLMSLQVDKDNESAISLYKKVGFEIKEPICEVDEDETQYIMDCTIENLIKNLENILTIKNY